MESTTPECSVTGEVWDPLHHTLPNVTPTFLTLSISPPTCEFFTATLIVGNFRVVLSDKWRWLVLLITMGFPPFSPNTHIHTKKRPAQVLHKFVYMHVCTYMHTCVYKTCIHSLGWQINARRVIDWSRLALSRYTRSIRISLNSFAYFKSKTEMLKFEYIFFSVGCLGWDRNGFGGQMLACRLELVNFYVTACSVHEGPPPYMENMRTSKSDFLLFCIAQHFI